jgi:uncharacterized protein HemX
MEDITPPAEKPKDELVHTSTTSGEGTTAVSQSSVATEPGQLSTPPSDESSTQKTDTTATTAVVDVVKKKSSPMVMIVAIVIIVVLALGTFGYFAIKMDSTKDSANTKQATITQATNAKDPASVANSVDTSMKKIDDTKDYNSTALSDTSLGL